MFVDFTIHVQVKVEKEDNDNLNIAGEVACGAAQDAISSLIVDGKVVGANFDYERYDSPKCKFVSVWENGEELESEAEYDEETGEVNVISPLYDHDDRGVLVREYIVVGENEEIEVCKMCHCSVIRGKMINIHMEKFHCMNPDCENH